MNIILVELESPLTAGRGVLYALREQAGGDILREPMPDDDPGRPLTDRIGDAVARDCEQVVIDLSGITAMVTEEVTWLTHFVWAVLTEGARPALVVRTRDVDNAVRHVKMDRAFGIFADLPAALAHLRDDA